MATKIISKAMIIDDHDADQFLCRRVLERSGYVQEVLSYQYADEALEYFRQGNRVDIIFLDINMPRMDGFEFLEAACEELGFSFSDMVVVMLTSSQNEEDILRSQEFEIVKDFCTKTLSPEYFEQLISRIEKGDFGDLGKVKSLTSS